MTLTLPPSSNKNTITQIQEGDEVSPSTANAPHTDLETNVDTIYAWLDSIKDQVDTTVIPAEDFESPTDTYPLSTTASGYAANHKRPFHIMTTSQSSGWPDSGYVISHWYDSQNCKQIFISYTNDIQIREVNGTSYPDWSSLKRIALSGGDISLSSSNYVATDVKAALDEAAGKIANVYTKAQTDSSYLSKGNNLSDVVDKVTARTNMDVYSKEETDASYVEKASNLSDLANAATARTNLSVYSKSESDTAYTKKASNLSDLANAATARTNLSVYSKSESDANYPTVANTGIGTTTGSGLTTLSSLADWQALPVGWHGFLSNTSWGLPLATYGYVTKVASRDTTNIHFGIVFEQYDTGDIYVGHLWDNATTISWNRLLKVGDGGWLGQASGSSYIDGYPATNGDSISQIYRRETADNGVAGFASSIHFAAVDTWGRLRVQHSAAHAWIQGGYATTSGAGWTAEVMFLDQAQTVTGAKTFSGSVVLPPGVIVSAQDTVGEGGEIHLAGAGSYKSVILDTVTNIFRIFGGTSAPLEYAIDSGQLKFPGRLFVNGNTNIDPAISLAIGDNDTGFNAAGDGVINIYSNNQVIAQILDTGFYFASAFRPSWGGGGGLISFGDFTLSGTAFNGSGYTKLPNGFIMQWGEGLFAANADTAVTLPVAFPNAMFQGYATMEDASTGSVNAAVPGVPTFSNSSITIRNTADSSIHIRWFAIGY